MKVNEIVEEGVLDTIQAGASNVAGVFSPTIRTKNAQKKKIIGHSKDKYKLLTIAHYVTLFAEKNGQVSDGTIANIIDNVKPILSNKDKDSWLDTTKAYLKKYQPEITIVSSPTTLDEAGFWSSIAKGMGAHDLSHHLDTAYQIKQARKQRATAASKQRRVAGSYNVSPVYTPQDEIPTSRTPQTTATAATAPIAPEVPEGQRITISIPPRAGANPNQPPSKYYKTNKGWFNMMNQPMPLNQYDFLDKVADAKGVMSMDLPPLPNPYVVRGRGRPAIQPTQQTALTPAEKQRLSSFGTPQAKPQIPPVYNPAMAARRRSITAGESKSNKGSVMNENKIRKLINEYTVKEMAVRRLKKEKLQEAKFGKQFKEPKKYNLDFVPREITDKQRKANQLKTNQKWRQKLQKKKPNGK